MQKDVCSYYRYLKKFSSYHFKQIYWIIDPIGQKKDLCNFKKFPCVIDLIQILFWIN